MQANKPNEADSETNDRNRQEPHDPVKAGREAIAAGKVNERGKPADRQQEDSRQDAGRWRNEG